MTIQPQIADSLFPDWTVPSQPDWIKGVSGGERYALLNRWSYMAGPIRQAEMDGLPQLGPIIAVMGQRPEKIRAKLGRAVWRKIHHATLATNGARAVLWWRWQDRLDWADLVEVKPCHLRKINRECRGRYWTDGAWYAGRMAPATAGGWRWVRDIYEDSRHMGVRVNPRWSLARLKKEHDAAGRREAAARHSPAKWAVPYRFEADGFHFERLISDQDLGMEGYAMRHCVAGFARQAKSGKLLIFRITGAQRATVSLTAAGHVHDLKSYANGRVSFDCKQAVQKLIEAVMAELETKSRQQMRTK
ncbi:PcfJ domain-containing protein [Mameliella alba]|uniref:PcfJ domain-containing protein n=1 Tax=Mameliella alba TaxID=561184 RepID=UPI0012FF7669|nr:PcfJ domain-containing protein [Mameliella alba]